MGLRATEAANMWRVQSLAPAGWNNECQCSQCAPPWRSRARARAHSHAHASLPRASLAVLLENTHLHPSYKVAVGTRALQPLIDESRANKRLRRSNPPAKIYGSGGDAFFSEICHDKNRTAMPGERLTAI